MMDEFFDVVAKHRAQSDVMEAFKNVCGDLRRPLASISVDEFEEVCKTLNISLSLKVEV